MRKALLLVGLAIPAFCLCLVAVYFLPPVRWRVDELVLKGKYLLNPPQKAVFVPVGGNTLTPPAALPETATWLATPTAAETVTATAILTSAPPSAQAAAFTATPSGPTVTPIPTYTPGPSPTLIPSPTSLPTRVALSGVVYQDQHGRYNYCAPANLAMALSFWGWHGDLDSLGPVLKPNPKDKNVMPYEMVDYIQGYTSLSVAQRVGGDLELLKRLIAAGYPVLIEKGTYLRDLSGVFSWMGHYQVLTGYDQAGGYFIAQDSYVKPDHQVPYADLLEHWRAFNYTYLLIYRGENEQQVQELLGADWDETANYQNAALKAANEVYGLSGIDQYFAFFNRGTNLVLLQDYAGASLAYDEAFAVYPTIPEAERPWRMLWYQTGPYFAYFYNQRYYDVLYLADGTLNAMQSDRNLEESYYWRGMAKAALGDTQGAIQDYLACLEYHENFGPALYQLSLLGVTP